MTRVNKILIIDDHHLFSDGLAMILESSGNCFNVDVSDDAESLLLDQKNCPLMI